MQERLAALRAIALKSAEALPDDQVRILRAVIMDSEGRVQWRQAEEGAWQQAKKDAVIQPGASIRTGLNSWLMLRVGINAHIFVNSGSRVTLPTMAHAGDTLKTIVQIDRGRTDINVGQVGLTNDFSVLTPSGALAVRGTGMGVSHSALSGTQVQGAQTNRMQSIAMKYYASKAAECC